jgi:hypothetical protein
VDDRKLTPQEMAHALRWLAGLEIPCKDCSGTGEHPGVLSGDLDGWDEEGKPRRCPACNGGGKVLHALVCRQAAELLDQPMDLLLAGQDTPEALREHAKLLRRAALRAKERAHDIESVARLEAQRARSDERAAEVAATLCAPVWLTEPQPPGGRWVVKAIQAGSFVVGHPLHASADRAYSTRSGLVPLGWNREPDRVGGRLDVGRTFEAWRTWCANRKAGTVTDAG